MGTIAKLAFKETLYKRIFLITLLMTLAYLVFFGIAAHYSASSVDEHNGMSAAQTAMQTSVMSTQMLGVGLFFSNFICVLLTIISGASSVSSEVESHQIDTLLARPLRRRDVIFGKFIGLGGLLLVYTVFLFGSLLLVDQLFGGALRYDLSLKPVLQAMGLFALEPLILLTVALWLSSRMTTINGGIVMIVLYGVGFIGGFMEQIAVLVHNTTLTNIGILSSLLFPIDSVFRKATVYLFHVSDDPIAMARLGIFGSASEPSAAMMVYAVLYGVLFLWLATRRFRKRDL
jgi:Cu-processing system permease protein